MILGLAGLLLFQAATALGAHAILRRRPLPAPLRLSTFLILRWLLQSLIILAAGCSGLLAPLPLSVGAALLLAGLLFLGEHRFLPRGFGALMREHPLACGIAALLLLRWMAQVWIFVPHVGDVLTYHLPKIAEWVRAGGFTREMGAHTHVTFPAGYELLETVWVVFLRHDGLIEAASADVLLLAFAAVRALALQLGLAPRAAVWAGLAYLLVPGFYLGSLSCLNDSAAAALILTAMAAAFGGGGLPLLATVAGLGLGVKPTFGFALPGICLLAWLSRGAAVSAGRDWAAAALANVVGAFWYVRNAVWFGNPFYPLGEPNFEDPTPVQFGPNLVSLWGNLRDLLNIRISDAAAPYSANGDHQAAWGILAFAVGSLGALEFLGASRPFRRLALGFGVSLSCLLLFSLNDPWCLKYVFFFPALLILGAVHGAVELPTLRPVLAAGLALCFFGTFLSYDLRGSDVWRLWERPFLTRSAAIFDYGRLQGRDPEGPVAYFGGPLGATYLLYRPDYSRQVFYPRIERETDLRAQMGGAAELFAPRPTPVQRRLLEEAVRAGRLAPVLGVWYRVPDSELKR